jgi:hypothetical protein
MRSPELLERRERRERPKPVCRPTDAVPAKAILNKPGKTA